MKKTLSIIYRICYIFFSLWAFGLLVVPLKTISPAVFLSFPSFTNFVGLICVIFLLFTAIKSRPGNALLRFKALCTFLGLVVIICNTDILTVPSAPNWIICILLPVMLLLDWLLFDKRGSLNLGDLLIWFGTLIFVGLLLHTILKDVLALSNFLDIWGLFNNKKELLSLAAKVILGGMIMYATDVLLSGKSTKGAANKIALLWRILFLLLEGWALFSISKRNLTVFVNSFSNFAILANFLSFICILAVIIYNLVKYGSLFKKASSFPRVKGIFTFAILVSALIYHFILKGSLITYSDWILYIIGPSMMFFDWIFFDKKGEFRLYEPFIWLILPIVHALIFQAINGFMYFNIYIFLNKVILMLITGIAVLVIDRILNRK